MNYRGNIKDAWHGLDVEATGKVTLSDLDFATAEVSSERG